MPTNKPTDEIIYVDEISAVLWELDPMRTGCAGDEAAQEAFSGRTTHGASEAD